jgi:hypothetical protein
MLRHCPHLLLARTCVYLSCYLLLHLCAEVGGDEASHSVAVEQLRAASLALELLADCVAECSAGVDVESAVAAALDLATGALPLYIAVEGGVSCSTVCFCVCVPLVVVQ